MRTLEIQLIPERRKDLILNQYDSLVNKALEDKLTAQDFYLSLGGTPYVLDGNKAVLLLDKKPWSLEHRVDAEVMVEMALTYQRPIASDGKGKHVELGLAPEPKKNWFERPLSRRAKILLGLLASASLIGLCGCLGGKENSNKLPQYFTINEWYDFCCNDFVDSDGNGQVDSLKSLDVGDQVYIKDVIEEIAFNESWDQTLIIFKDSRLASTYYVPDVTIHGNYSGQFKPGDKIIFTLTIVNGEVYSKDNNFYMAYIWYGKVYPDSRDYKEFPDVWDIEMKNKINHAN